MEWLRTAPLSTSVHTNACATHAMYVPRPSQDTASLQYIRARLPALHMHTCTTASCSRKGSIYTRTQAKLSCLPPLSLDVDVEAPACASTPSYTCRLNILHAPVSTPSTTHVEQNPDQEAPV